MGARGPEQSPHAEGAAAIAQRRRREPPAALITRQYRRVREPERCVVDGAAGLDADLVRADRSARLNIVEAPALDRQARRDRAGSIGDMRLAHKAPRARRAVTKAARLRGGVE